jgi:hypothetical protein
MNGKPGRKAEHVDAIFALPMLIDQRLDADSQGRRGGFEIGAAIAFVADRQAPQPER